MRFIRKFQCNFFLISSSKRMKINFLWKKILILANFRRSFHKLKQWRSTFTWRPKSHRIGFWEACSSEVEERIWAVILHRLGLYRMLGINRPENFPQSLFFIFFNIFVSKIFYAIPSRFLMCNSNAHHTCFRPYFWIVCLWVFTCKVFAAFSSLNHETEYNYFRQWCNKISYDFCVYFQLEK